MEMIGVEPMTFCVQNRYSTTELHEHHKHHKHTQTSTGNRTQANGFEDRYSTIKLWMLKIQRDTKQGWENYASRKNLKKIMRSILGVSGEIKLCEIYRA